jgi:hypothetical protein
MAIILGVNQKAKIYQLIQNNNNYSYINNSNSSNLLFLNVDENTHNNATINFRNKYEIGYIDNKISIYHTSNIITFDDININLYKDTIIHNNLNVSNYFNTLNNTTFFKNNVNINLNNNIENSFKIIYNNTQSLLELNKLSVIFNSDNIYTSNIYINPSSTLFTNFIDSPNENPVIIRNMAFAESLRIFTTSIIQNISIDNDIIFSNLENYKPNIPNKEVSVSEIYKWTNYLIDNNINIQDRTFTKPNINIQKFIGYDLYNNIVGGLNMLEFRTREVGTYTSNLVYSINNKGYINIGSNYNSNIAFNIKINPITSNIIQYTNLNDIKNCYAINSNGYVNIGSLAYYPNQLNIIKNNNNDRNNTELISLNITNTNYTTNDNTISIPFINNNDINDFIFNFTSTYETTIINLNIIITNLFITNNIINVGNILLYEDTEGNYAKTIYEVNNITDTSIILTFDRNIKTTLIYPNNVFKIDPIQRINNIISFIIYPVSFTITPLITNTNLFNKIEFIKIINNYTIIIIFYIYIYDYIYNYTGIYLPKKCDLINAKTNNNKVFSISENGNIGLGTYYSEKYKLYINSNALINNLECKTIDNYITKNISFSSCSLNNIININASNMNVANLNVSSIANSNIITSNIIINNNIKVLDNNGSVIINAKTVLGNSDIRYNDHFLTLNTNTGFAIINNSNNNNPNFIIKSNATNTYPYIRLQNTVKTYDLAINTLNNFELRLNNTQSIIKNDTNNNNICLLDNCLNIYKDSSSNIKIFAGRCWSYNSDNVWYEYMSDIGTNPIYKSSFNMYGNFNVYSSIDINDALISCHANNNNDIKIGLGINYISTNEYYNENGLLIDLNTVITSNLRVNKNIYLGGTILSVSDSNLKTNIHKIENSLDKIDKINGYTYVRTDTGNIESGLIAQEVYQILPEVIKFENNRYNISYGNMCGLLVECIKELKEKIITLENKNKY